MTKEQFVQRIREEKYPHYTLRNIKGDVIPVSKKDGIITNNLG